jgi:very-short-patch-repair endonuclease
MQFALSGLSALARGIEVPTDPEFDSPFEEEVCQVLQGHGLTVHRQIGCAGYRIDLAVVDAEQPGRYLLAIECDGATYHSSKTARDRDRLRQQVLEEMGWRGRILRIWSSDWVQNRDGQVLRVLQALANARSTAEDSLPSVNADNENAPAEEPQAIELATDREAESAPHICSPSTILEQANALPKGVRSYQAYKGEHQGESAEFYDLAVYDPGHITAILVSVVQQEGPIHILEATRRVISCWGMGRAGPNLVTTVEIAATRAGQRGSIAIRGEFLWPSEMSQPVVRVPSDGDVVRSIEYVSLEEIAEACILCVRDAYAIQQDELITQAARLLGYHRTGTNVRDRISEAITFACEQGKVEVKDGAVTLR